MFEVSCILRKRCLAIDSDGLEDDNYVSMKFLISFLAFLIGMTYFSLSGKADESESEETPLEEQMGEMNVFFKKIRKTEDAVEGAKFARSAQETAINSLAFIPIITEKVTDPAQKEKDIADYKRMVGLTYVAFCEVELAFLEGDMEKVNEIVDRLRKLKKQGHTKYIED